MLLFASIYAWFENRCIEIAVLRVVSACERPHISCEDITLDEGAELNVVLRAAGKDEFYLTLEDENLYEP
jgi:hypothetical protein